MPTKADKNRLVGKKTFLFRFGIFVTPTPFKLRVLLVFLLWRCLFHGNRKVEGLTDCNIYYDYGLFCLSIVGYALLRLIMVYVLLWCFTNLEGPVCILADFFLNISYIFGVTLLTSKHLNLIEVFLMHLNQHVPTAMEYKQLLVCFCIFRSLTSK